MTKSTTKPLVLRTVRYFIIVLAVLLSLTAGYALYIKETNNFHEITPGEAYRSAQPDKDRLEYYIKEYGIKSVLNLRGRNADKTWYLDEIETCSRLGAEHYDVGLSAYHEPDQKQVRQLLEVFRSAKRPILIHCRGGADRSGLVAAMWKVIVDKDTKISAEKQLTIWYGHIPFTDSDAMDHFFDTWSPVLQ